MGAELFRQYLQPVKSVDDYMADMDQRDLRRAQLAGTMRQNALADLAAQQTVEQQRQRNALREAVQSGQIDLTNPAHLNAVLTRFPDAGPAAMDAAQKVLSARAQADEAAAKARQADASAGKDTQATAEAKRKAALMQVLSFSSPDDALASLNSASDISMQDRTLHGRAIQAAAANPQAFREWQIRTALAIAGAKDYAEGTKPTLGSTNLGGTEQYTSRDPITGAVTINRTDRRTQSPDNAATVGEQRRHNIVTEGQGAIEWKQDADGKWVGLPKKVDPSATVQPIATTAPGKREIQAGHALDIIKEARQIIPDATGSYVGAAADQVARAVGASTEGAQNTAKLKAIEGALMMAQPRMEGPQSDKDVALYRQMAGQIGDPTIPNKTKLAALDAIEGLHRKYAPGQASGLPAKPATVSNW